MKEQLKEFEFVWLISKWIAEQLFDLIRRGLAIFLVGIFAVIWPVMAISWAITKIFSIDYDNDIFTKDHLQTKIFPGDGYPCLIVIEDTIRYPNFVT